jgi:hypothetical protein
MDTRSVMGRLRFCGGGGVGCRVRLGAGRTVGRLELRGIAVPTISRKGVNAEVSLIEGSEMELLAVLVLLRLLALLVLALLLFRVSISMAASLAQSFCSPFPSDAGLGFGNAGLLMLLALLRAAAWTLGRLARTEVFPLR